ncbi:MAG: hypothetical protein ACE5I3_15940 [Phycisphaerae bacterium]
MHLTVANEAWERAYANVGRWNDAGALREAQRGLEGIRDQLAGFSRADGMLGFGPLRKMVRMRTCHFAVLLLVSPVYLAVRRRIAELDAGRAGAEQGLQGQKESQPAQTP